MATPSSEREAMLYRRGEGGACECALCAHRCRLAPGARGICHVRENRDGTLRSLVYGMLIAANADPIEKKPLYHFLPGTMSFSIATPGCNFQCDFCQNWRISQMPREEGIDGEYTPAEAVVSAAKRHRCPSISYTYTEPTIYFEYAFDCARLAKAEGLRNVFVTNGYQTPETIERMAGLIAAANVDLKAFTEEFYRERCRAKLAPVCEAIRLMRQAGIHVEVTTLLIPEHNDGEEELARLAEFLAGVDANMPWHVSRYHPDYRFDAAPVTPAKTLYRAVEAGRKAGLRYVYAGNLHGDDLENTVCPGCRSVLVRRSGFSARMVGLDGVKCRHCGHGTPIIL
jgi:pyruvate formate lyase activating enzyme